MCIYLTLVYIHARVRDLIKHEANFAVAPKTTDLVGTHLVAITGILISSTFINIDALFIMPTKTRCTWFHFFLRWKWIVFHHSNTVI